MSIEQELQNCLFVAHSLFERGKVAGSAANLSVKMDDKIYITRSGGCFGRLAMEDFSVVDLQGNLLEGQKPSKEFPLHRMMYEKDSSVKAVLHTHSPYATLWSCLPNLNPMDAVPEHTPYLRMQIGAIALIPFAPPGSEQLFANFAASEAKTRGFLLAHHGPIVGAKDMMSTFYQLEELEESCRVAWMLKDIAGTELPR